MTQGIKETRKVFTATIANNGSLSAAVNLSGWWLMGIQCPAAWTTAAITLQGSYDGTTYANVRDGTAELSIPAAAGAFCSIEPWQTAGLRWIKVRSGTGDVPVAQGAERSIQLVCIPITG